MNRTCQITSDRCAHKMTVYSSDIADDVSVCYDDTLWISSSTTGVVYCHHIIWGMKLNEWGERENEWMDEWVSNWMSEQMSKWESGKLWDWEEGREGRKGLKERERKRGRNRGRKRENHDMMCACAHTNNSWGFSLPNSWGRQQWDRVEIEKDWNMHDRSFIPQFVPWCISLVQLEISVASPPQ